jgi:molybdopterin converting factor subunit 1
MTVNIRLFAIMAQSANTGALPLDLPPGASAAAVRPALQSRFKNLPWPNGTMLAVNQEYATPETPLHPGDEVAIIPPVSGG